MDWYIFIAARLRTKMFWCGNTGNHNRHSQIYNTCYPLQTYLNKNEDFYVLKEHILLISTYSVYLMMDADNTISLDRWDFGCLMAI